METGRVLATDKGFRPESRGSIPLRSTSLEVAVEHTKDSDCDVDPETDCCRACGVLHGDHCPDCGGVGFHRDTCPEMVLSADEAAQNIIDAGGM
jgi:hypothetical protein